MANTQGFRTIGTDPYVYQEVTGSTTASVAMGIDSAGPTFNLCVSSSVDAQPGVGFIAFAVDPISGDITLTPLGGGIIDLSGPVRIPSLVDTDGVVYWNGTILATTTVGTAGDVLTSNGAGMAPTFQTGGGGGVTSAIGTANQIAVSAATGAVTFSIPSTFIAPGTIAATTTVAAGTNVLLPTTSSSAGHINFNSVTQFHTFGTNSAFIGSGAGNYTFTGVGGNYGIGLNALHALTTGSTNVAIGNACLTLCTTGSNNVAIGLDCLLVATATANNVAIGNSSLSSLTIATGQNVAVGENALLALQTGSGNTAIGPFAGQLLSTNDSNNIVIGRGSGLSGDNNILRVGYDTTNATFLLKSFIDGIRGVTTDVNDALPVVIDSLGQLGTGTLTGVVTSAIGTANQIAVSAATGAVTFTIPSTFIAPGTIASTTTLTAGTNILLPTTSSTAGNINFNSVTQFHTFGTANVFIGDGSGNYTTSGVGRNQGIGHNTLLSLTTGVENTAIGNLALTACTSSSNNVAIGNNALQALLTGVGENIAIGDSSLGALTTGTQNTGVGPDAAGGVLTGNNNIAIGFTSGLNWNGAESNNVYVGTARGTASESNVIRIGYTGASNTTQITKCFIDGIRGITTVNADAVAVLVDSAGQLGTVSSSIRYKENVNDMGVISSLIHSLRPVSFNLKTSPDRRQTGLIAEEVERVMPELVAYNQEGTPESVKYHDLPALLLNELQKAFRKIEELSARISALELK